MSILKKPINKKSLVIILGSLLIIVGITLISHKYINDNTKNNAENKAVEEFYDKDKINTNNNENNLSKEKITPKNEVSNINYVAILKIPKINLTRGLVDRNSRYNNVNYNVEILDDSDTPDAVNGNVILAGHSGNARISYFRHLDKLTNGDEIILDYKNHSYEYIVSNIYDVEKTGTAVINRDTNKNTLTLITCRHNTKKQIVVISYLKSIKN